MPTSGPAPTSGRAASPPTTTAANKHRTKIGEGARISVNTSLVAPVTVGDGAYTGAGAVIREDVPDGALGVSSNEQRNIEGYAERKKAKADEAGGAEE